MSQLPPLVVTTKVQQALTAHKQGQLDEAARLYKEILEASPEHFDALHLLGVIEMQSGNPELAAALIGKAVQIDRKKTAAHNNLGTVLRALGRQEEALASFNKAIALDVNNADAHYNRALVLMDLKRYDQALAGFRKTTVLNPDHAPAHVNTGITLQALDRLEDAQQAFSKALARDPKNADIHHNLGHLMQIMRRPDEARRYFEGAIARDPTHAEAHVALGQHFLQTGDYAQGWKEYEWRWSTHGLHPLMRSFSQPVWSGENIEGKTILVHAEQGLGDTLQFVRYVARVRDLGAKVILEVQPALKRLLSGLESCAQVLAAGDPLPDFDAHCPLLSLPLALDVGGDFVNTPYLKPDNAWVEHWAERMGPSPGLRCGIVWSGALADRGSARYRNIPVAALKDFDANGIQFVGLQPDLRDDDKSTLAVFPDFQNLGPEFQDFADTAGMIANLDLVISIDTSVAHLAGAMGKPVWVLLAHACDWRWDLGSTSESPLYPSARLFRQPKLNDWESVIKDVSTALRAFKPES